MTLDSFFPYILPEVPGCPDPTLRLQTALAAIEFCRETKAWSAIQDPIPLVDNQKEYVIPVVTDSYVHDVRDVWLGNRRLTPRSMRAIQEEMPQWATATSNEPIYYNQAATRGSLSVFPTPVNTNGTSIVVRAVYVPTATAATLPAFLLERHLNIISAGVKAALMMMPAMPWSNPQMGVYYKSIFDDGVIKVRIEEAHDRVSGSVAVVPRRFGF